jgi:hypothetical protein
LLLLLLLLLSLDYQWFERREGTKTKTWRITGRRAW